jgi:uncharacterized protein with HEPN domain
MKRVYEDYLRDMLENAEKALSFVNGMTFEEFKTDDKRSMLSFEHLKLLAKLPAKFPKA